MKKIVILLVMSSLFGCRDISKNKAISMNTANQSDAELRQLIIQKGDSCAYDKLSVQYLDYGYQDFLFYAVIIANKYNYPQAYFDLFFCLIYEYIDIYELIDEKTAALAIEYLIKAANMGHKQAQEMISEYDITEFDTNYVTQIKRIYE